ncbi:MAG: Ig-like domain-containing protein [Myxococcota bacterium]
MSSSGGTSSGASSAEGTTTNGNSAPLAVNDTIYATQDSLGVTVNLLDNDSDPDGDSISAIAEDLISETGGAITIAKNGTISYLPPAGFWGTDSFGYSIEDSEGATSSADVQVFVAPSAITINDMFEQPSGFAIEGEVIGDAAGASLSGGEDFNQDGFSDLILGAPRSDDNGNSSGKAYLVYGTPDTATIQLSSVSDGVGGFAFTAEDENDDAGIDVSWAGDVNGDGDPDLLIGAEIASGPISFSGRAYVVLGPVGSLSLVAAGNQGFVVNGEEPLGTFGESVRRAGDVNADGLDDIIIGASRHNDNAGQSYVVFGKQDTDEVNGSDIHTGMGGFTINGSDGELSGRAVDGIGDVNGDGFADLLVGAYSGDIPHGPNSGLAYVVFGKSDTDSVSLSQVATGSGGFVIVSESEGDWLGYTVAGVGDVNGDSIGDIVVAAPRAGTPSSGRVYVVFGKSGGAPVQLTEVTAGMGGYVITGTPSEQLGLQGVSGVGDVNADGLADIAAIGMGPGYVFYGKTDTFSINAADASSGEVGFEVGPDADAVSGAGDVNGDGVDDIAFSAWSVDGLGRTYVLFGVPTDPAR